MDKLVVVEMLETAQDLKGYLLNFYLGQWTFQIVMEITIPDVFHSNKEGMFIFEPSNRSHK